MMATRHDSTLKKVRIEWLNEVATLVIQLQSNAFKVSMSIINSQSGEATSYRGLIVHDSLACDVMRWIINYNVGYREADKALLILWLCPCSRAEAPDLNIWWVVRVIFTDQ